MRQRLSALLALCFSAISLVACGDSPCDVLGLSSFYNIIVVGSGPGGSVAARRLAEFNPNESILQIERGSAFVNCTLCQSASDAIRAGRADQNPAGGKAISTVPQSGLGNKQISFLDVSVQGGGTSVNAMVWVRTNANYYFDNFWPANWNWTAMEPYYELVENFTPTAGSSVSLEGRGTAGLVAASQVNISSTVTSFLNAVSTVFPNAPVTSTGSLNSGDNPGYGAAVPEVSSNSQLHRSSAYPAYVGSYSGSNLISITNVRVERVLFEGNRVSGVEIVFISSSGVSTSSTCEISANTVVVSAGTIGTAKLLKLSGIGGSAELDPLNIQVVSDLPAVGSNLDEQFVIYVATSTSVPSSVISTSPNINGVLFWNSADDTSKPLDTEIELNLSPSGIGSLNTGVFSVQKLNARSRGNVTLKSASSNDDPLVDPSYLTNTDDFDELALALNKTITMTQVLGLRFLLDPCASRSCDTPSKLLSAYIDAGSTTSGYHFTSTARIVDVVSPDDLSVAGVLGLYVLDASILPQSPGGNPSATIYAVAEHGVRLIQSSIVANSSTPYDPSPTPKPTTPTPKPNTSDASRHLASAIGALALIMCCL